MTEKLEAWQVWSFDEKPVKRGDKKSKAIVSVKSSFRPVKKKQQFCRHYTILFSISASGCFSALRNNPLEIEDFLGELIAYSTGSGCINKTTLRSWAADVFIKKINH